MFAVEVAESRKCPLRGLAGQLELVLFPRRTLIHYQIERAQVVDAADLGVEQKKEMHAALAFG